MFAKHPRGLVPLFFTEMWERFSFYCMLALLTLFMTAPAAEGGLGFSTAVATQIYGLYIGFIYFTPFGGGIIADKFWGYSRTIVAGGLLMMGGHLALAGEGLAFFFLGLGLLILGNGLFKPNISTMLGNLYKGRNELKDQGYNIFYMGINIGAFIAPLTAYLINTHFGWHAAFGIAAAGMLLSLVIFLSCRHLVAEGEIAAFQPAPEQEETIPVPVQRLRVQALLIIFGVVIFFWMAFKQNGSTLLLWARDHTLPVGEFEFSGKGASVAKAINPFLVITLTPLLVLFWESLRRRGLEVSTPKKMVVGMVLTAVSCAAMALGGLAGGDSGRVTVLWLIGGYFFITVGELCISPMGLSVVSKLAPKASAGIWMGGWFVATSLGNYAAGTIGFLWDVWAHSSFFLLLTGTSLAAAGLLCAFLPWLEAAMASLTQPHPQKEAAPAMVLAGNGNGASETGIEEAPSQGIR
ncbi:MAG: peptide MFS transporter [Gemmataceae bacterium]|nr:peptide MFS transporter [Gemmataceae bacterium]